MNLNYFLLSLLAGRPIIGRTSRNRRVYSKEKKEGKARKSDVDGPTDRHSPTDLLSRLF